MDRLEIRWCNTHTHAHTHIYTHTHTHTSLSVLHVICGVLVLIRFLKASTAVILSAHSHTHSHTRTHSYTDRQTKHTHTHTHERARAGGGEHTSINTLFINTLSSTNVDEKNLTELFYVFGICHPHILRVAQMSITGPYWFALLQHNISLVWTKSQHTCLPTKTMRRLCPIPSAFFYIRRSVMRME